MLQEDHYHILICHPKSEKILIRQDKRLPVIKWEGYLSRETDVLCKRVTYKINAAFDLNFLRVECESRVGSWFTPTLMIFEVSGSDIPSPPEQHVWISQPEVDQVGVYPSTEAVIRYLKAFKRLGLNVNGDRLVPYSQSGWFKEASSWMKKRLTEANQHIKEVTQLRNGTESYILTGLTDSGSKFYMKALPPRTFNDEVTVSCVLAEFMPWTFPKPMFVDRERRWMVMEDYGRALLEDECSMEANPDLVRKVLSEWAGIQKKLIATAEEFGKLGVPVYDGNGYKERVEHMLNDSEYLEAQWEGMTEEEKGKYGKEGYKRELLAYVKRLCGRLSEYSVPLTIVHGDLNASNMIPDGTGSFKFIDLAYACISFPFLDAVIFMGNCGLRKGNRKLDFYLQLWTEFESMERLRELFDLVEELREVDGRLISLHFYKKAEESSRCSARTELGYPLCSKFNKYL